MLSQHHSNRLSADLIDNAAPDRLLGDQPNRPACPTVGWWPAHQSHQRSLLTAVEHGLVTMVEPRLFAQRMLKAAGQVAVRDTRDLTPIRSQRSRGRLQAHAPIQHQQGLHPSPNAISPLLAGAAPTTQLAAVSRRQLQPLEPTDWLHPPL